MFSVQQVQRCVQKEIRLPEILERHGASRRGHGGSWCGAVRFRKKSEIIEAVWFDGTSDSATEVFNLVGLPTDDNIIVHNPTYNAKENKTTYQFIRVPALNGTGEFFKVYPESWVIRGPLVGILACGDVWFREHYEVIGET
jgi:hypothetical protein